MSMNTLTIATAALALGVSTSISAFEIQYIDAGGRLVFSSRAGATSYRIQATQDPTNPASWVNVGDTIVENDANSYTTVVHMVSAPLSLFRVFAVLEQLQTNQVLIPQGTFVMGGVNTPESTNFVFELPPHTNAVSSFYIDAYEVSYSLWNAIANHAGGQYTFTTHITGTADTHPVRNVNWYDAVKWCNARSEMEGLTPVYYTDAGYSNIYKTGEVNINNAWVNWSANGYRLPTEAEWEKAARAGTTTRFPWGDTIAHQFANYQSDTSYTYDVSATIGSHPNYNNGTSPVDAFEPNALGLYNMIGNVREWCWDYFNADYYGNSPVQDPTGPASGLTRVLRGGAFNLLPFFERVAYRDQALPDRNLNNVGFRCVRRP